MNNLSSEEFVNNDKGLQCFRKVCINTVKNFAAIKRKYNTREAYAINDKNVSQEIMTISRLKNNFFKNRTE